MSIQGALHWVERKLEPIEGCMRPFSRIPVFGALASTFHIPVAIYNFPRSFVLSLPQAGKDLWETPLKAVYRVALVVLRTAFLPTNLVHSFARWMGFTKELHINAPADTPGRAIDSSGEFLSEMEEGHKQTIIETFKHSPDKGRLALLKDILRTESYRVGYVFLETIDYLKQFAQCLWNFQIAKAHVCLQKGLEHVVLLPLAILAWLPAIVTKIGTLLNPAWSFLNQRDSYYTDTVISL